MAYVSAEQTEEPAKCEHQYIPTELPQFKKGRNPLSILAGDSVFLQDEPSRIEATGFRQQEAARVLTAEFETCRQTHAGHVLRQQIDVERCSIIEYRYRHAGKTYAIYVNPLHELVEDISGPVQAAIENTDGLAEKAFDEQRYEEAYRLNLRSLCMDEATAAEKELRDKILKRLTGCYRNTGLVVWLVAAVVWLCAGGMAAQPRLNFGVLLGLIPVIAGAHIFARDTALRFRSRVSRAASAILIGASGFLAGVPVSSESMLWDKSNHWMDWFPLGFVVLALVGVAIARNEERSRRNRIEEHTRQFPDANALEAYVYGLDPKDGVEMQAILALCGTAFALVCAAGLIYASRL